MSLKSIWNSLRGRSSETESPNQSEAAPAPPATVMRVERPAKPKVQAPAIAVRPEPIALEITPPRRGVLSMLSRGEHDGLLKLVSQSRPTSVLEIGIGDGSRMPAILAMMQQSGVQASSFKAMVIDEFEMGGGPVTMRDYHRQLAGLTIRPVLFPEPVGRGLINVAHRFGFVDLILIDAKVESTQADALQYTLGKVVHGSTVLLNNTSGKWTSRQAKSSTRRAA